VSHGDVIRAALMYFLGMPIDFVHRLDIAPARITIVDLSDDAPRVLQVNGDSVP
jgi:probable phosphoglycerate mutase